MPLSVVVVGSYAFAMVNYIAPHNRQIKDESLEIIKKGTDLDCKLIGRT